jgi:hypothetical protein
MPLRGWCSYVYNKLALYHWLSFFVVEIAEVVLLFNAECASVTGHFALTGTLKEQN